MMEPPKDFSLLREVFNERGALLAFFGALGGAVRAGVLKTTWREGLRVILLGMMTAFGFGVLTPWLLSPYLGEMPADMKFTIGTYCALAFITGLVSVTLLERWIDKKEVDKNDGEG